MLHLITIYEIPVALPIGALLSMPQQSCTAVELNSIFGTALVVLSGRIGFNKNAKVGHLILRTDLDVNGILDTFILVKLVSKIIVDLSIICCQPISDTRVDFAVHLSF